VDKFPEWATEKQKEGMKEFLKVADSYGQFDVIFEQSQYPDYENRFLAVVTWENIYAKGVRSHKFDIDWDYEETWDKYGDRIYQWQFLFSGGEATREISTEVFFIDLFFEIDKKLNLDSQEA